MTVETSISKSGPYAGAGTTGPFTVNFRFLDQTHLRVIRTDGTGEHVLVLNTDYTVAGTGNPTGSVTLAIALPIGQTLTIIRNVPKTQEADYVQNDDFPAQSHEDALDKLTMITQQVQEVVDRTVTFPASDSASATAELPVASLRANNLLGFDAIGRPIAIAATPQSATALQILLASNAGASMIGFDGTTLDQQFKSRVIRVVDNIAALKALSKNTYTRAAVCGYTALGDGGGGMYWLDATDTISADNGGTIIVAADGARWKLQHNGVIHIAQWGNNLANAVDNMPVGGVLLLGNTPVVANFSKTRFDLTIRGAGMPSYNAGGTALTGGSIIQGKLQLNGDRLRMENFGVDCGSDVCTAINGGTGMDALVITDAAGTIRNNIVVKDVICLLKDPAAAFHNFLLQGLDKSNFQNLIARNGQWGVVMKTTNSNGSGFLAYNCSQAGFTFKADSGVTGTPALRCNVSNVFIDNSGLATAVQGILIYAATSSLADFTLTNAQTRGGDIGVKLVCDTRAVNVNLLRDVTMSNIIIEDAVTYGFDTFGAIAGVEVSNMDIRNTTSNKSLHVQSDCLGIHFSNVNCSAPVVNSLNVDLAGRFTFDGLRSFVNGDYNSPSGINIAPESASTFKVGKYLGTMGLNGVQTWVPAWTGLTVVNGTGGATFTGSYRFDGPFIEGEAQIATTGTCTTQSTASSTFINNLPYQPVRNSTCTVVSGTVTDGGIGLVQTGGTNCFTSSWAAAGGTRVVQFRYRFQTN